MPSRGKVRWPFGRRQSPPPTLWRAAKDPRLSREQHPSRGRGAKSFADDLVEDRGVVTTRAVSHCDVLKVSLQIYDLFATALMRRGELFFFAISPTISVIVGVFFSLFFSPTHRQSLPKIRVVGLFFSLNLPFNLPTVRAECGLSDFFRPFIIRIKAFLELRDVIFIRIGTFSASVTSFS